jgi:sortase (surface protein transpeptidase)
MRGLWPRDHVEAVVGSLAVVALLAALASLGLGPSGAPVTTISRSPITAPSPTGTAHLRQEAAGRDVNLSGQAVSPQVAAPTAMTIPSIGVNTSLVDLGINADGTAQVPSNTAVAGWYDLSPRPGQLGAAVILGHVDSHTGPGVFFKLSQLQPGASISVQSGATSETFVVQTVDLYSKSSFPTATVFGPVPQHALRLVTCGGPFDHETGSYEDNWVVFAVEGSDRT